MTHTLRFRQADKQLFADIRSGRKTVETRAATTSHQKLAPGDTLKFVCGQEVITKEITNVAHFPSIEALFKSVPLQKVLPDVKTLTEAKKIYYSFPGYQEKISHFGLLAFFLK